MAIDTDNEKFSLITYNQMWNTPIPTSSDGLGELDKQHLIAQYAGLDWFGPLSVADNCKLSMITYQEPFMAAIPYSNDGIGQLDSQQLMWQTACILLGGNENRYRGLLKLGLWLR